MRKSGILLPVASLPSAYGIGSFSREAYEFVDRLGEAGQSYWQILPLGPTGYGDSPYQSFSTFAGNPYFIDPATMRSSDPSVMTGGAMSYPATFTSRVLNDASNMPDCVSAQ